jgi:hypothetical protein
MPEFRLHGDRRRRDIDAPRRHGVATPEATLLKKIEHELTVLSEAQHAQARQVAILRKARTLLHVGCSSIEVNAMLTEHLRKERAQRSPLVRTRAARPGQIPARVES